MYKIIRYDYRNYLNEKNFRTIVGSYPTIKDAMNYLYSIGCKDIQKSGETEMAAEDPQNPNWGIYIIYNWKVYLKKREWLYS